MILGVGCTRIEYDPDRANHAASRTYRAKSLDHYGTRILVDGKYWIPVNSGVVVGWMERDAQ
jgi:hypothetical protein